MVLNNTEISKLIYQDNMIKNYEQESISNCSYKIRVGDLIEPETGDVIKFSEKYNLWPTKTILFRSAEKVKLPQNITASYSALYSVSSVGILLINASMIGPGYEGYLSGMLLNFSAQKFEVRKNMNIARITFFKQIEDIGHTYPDDGDTLIDDDGYLRDLKKKAENKYHASFMNIDNFSKSVENKVFKKIKTNFYVLITVVSLLVIFAEVEPFIQGWALRTAGFLNIHEVAAAKTEISYAELKTENAELRKEVNDLKIQLEQCIRQTVILPDQENQKVKKK